MQDEMQKQHINLAAKIIKKLLSLIVKDLEQKRNDLSNIIKSAKKNAPSKDTKAFVRKYKNQGLYKMQDLDKNLANELAKKLKSYNQDFVKTENNNGKYDIVVTKANASLMDELLPKCQKSVQKRLEKKTMTKEQIARKAESITNVMSRAKREANKLKEKHPDRLAPVKHKDIGAI